MIQHFADAMAVTRPITLVRPAQLDATIAMQTPEVAAWLRQTGFAGALGEIQLIPGLQGVAGAMLGVGDSVAQKRTRFGLTRAISTLPSGNWHLDGDLPVDQIREIALGWLLAFYKFDRYRTAKPQKPQPLLKLPAGIDAHQIIAMAEGEFLTRDLINTPASDMGPAELGAAFHALAANLGALCTKTCG
jgi:leucyl aminopeptidase